MFVISLTADRGHDRQIDGAYRPIVNYHYGHDVLREYRKSLFPPWPLENLERRREILRFHAANRTPSLTCTLLEIY